MQQAYEMASQLLSNLKFTSDNVDMIDCYYMCANKEHLEDLRIKDHQVIWGRRGTGKTTLMKAFTYDINYFQQEPSNMAFYILMSNVIPTGDEIKLLPDDGSSLVAYIFIKLICELMKQLEEKFNERSGAMEEDDENKFVKAYYELSDYIYKYKINIQGGELSIQDTKLEEQKNETNKKLDLGIGGKKNLLAALANYSKNQRKSTMNTKAFTVSGKIQFNLDIQLIKEYIINMLKAFKLSTAYICIDEYSEMDKVSQFSIQSKVAQLIKQVFFKNTMFSVKIATIWNRSKLHSRGENRVEGIEYQQDIFAGPDLDIMFMENNADVIGYFKEVLINTYLMGAEMNDNEKEACLSCIETYIFGTTGLRHLICGSQGVSRAFVILVKEYLKKFIKNKNGPLKLGDVYQIIKHHYLEDVRNKIPYFTLYKAIKKYTLDNLCRYFLIKEEDYHRCKPIIKYLTARGLFMQMPGHLTDIEIRDEYKLFIIHYGKYLDALESASHKDGRKKLDEDAKLEANGMLVPEYNSELVYKPELYTVVIPQNAELELYCTSCKKIFESDKKDAICPICGKEIVRFDAFVDEVSI